MKMLRKKFTFLLMIAMITMLSGCAGKQEAIEVDISNLCNELLQKADFEDKLAPVDDAVIQRLYGVEDYVKALVYISSGATAEEIALFEFAGNETAEEGLSNALARIEEQKFNFESYIPKEVKKLDDAFVKQYGNYVIVCISNSDEAEKVITQYVNQ